MNHQNKDQTMATGEDIRVVKRAISKDTAISIGLAAMIVGAVLWLSDNLHRIDTRLLSIESRIENRWTYQEMKIWSQGLQIKNPTLNVPEVNGDGKIKP